MRIARISWKKSYPNLLRQKTPGSTLVFGMSSEQLRSRQLYLTNRWILILFVYYFIVIIAGSLLAILALVPSTLFNSAPSIFSLGLIGSAGMAANGSGIFYMRKLYKLCFAESLMISSSVTDYPKLLGTIIYFIARPLFSVGFAILVVIGVRAGFFLTIEGPAQLTSGFVYATMFVSFFVGFLSGRFIKQLEKSGSSVIEKLKP